MIISELWEIWDTWIIFTDRIISFKIPIKDLHGRLYSLKESDRKKGWKGNKWDEGEVKGIKWNEKSRKIQWERERERERERIMKEIDKLESKED